MCILPFFSPFLAGKHLLSGSMLLEWTSLLGYKYCHAFSGVDEWIEGKYPVEENFWFKWEEWPSRGVGALVMLRKYSWILRLTLETMAIFALRLQFRLWLHNLRGWQFLFWVHNFVYGCTTFFPMEFHDGFEWVFSMSSRCRVNFMVNGGFYYIWMSIFRLSCSLYVSGLECTLLLWSVYSCFSVYDGMRFCDLCDSVLITHSIWSFRSSSWVRRNLLCFLYLLLSLSLLWTSFSLVDIFDKFWTHRTSSELFFFLIWSLLADEFFVSTCLTTKTEGQ